MKPMVCYRYSESASVCMGIGMRQLCTGLTRKRAGVKWNNNNININQDIQVRIEIVLVGSVQTAAAAAAQQQPR